MTLIAKDTEGVVDNVETLISLALYADCIHKVSDEVVQSTVKIGGKEHLDFVISDASRFLDIKDLKPQSCYTFDMADSERLVSFNKDYLVTHPADIIGDRGEILLICDDRLKWCCCKRRNKVPKGMSYLGKIHSVYERHYREIDSSGKSVAYSKALLAFDKNGKVVPLHMMGREAFNSKFEHEQSILVASIIEDANRSGTMLASVKDSIELKFPVPIADYKNLFSDRDDPLTKSGNRKAIVHWVKKHLKINHNTSWDVKKHIRGVQEFVIDGFKIRIEPNDKY